MLARVSPRDRPDAQLDEKTEEPKGEGEAKGRKPGR
jgi:hypothetical protein